MRSILSVVMRYNLASMRNILGSVTARLTRESSFKLHRCHQEDQPLTPPVMSSLIGKSFLLLLHAIKDHRLSVNPNRDFNRFSLSLPLSCHVMFETQNLKLQKSCPTVLAILKLPRYGPLLISTTSAKLSWAKKQKRNRLQGRSMLPDQTP